MADLITTAGSGATFNVYYKAENRQKRIEWVSGTATVNDLYSALQDQFDELNQLDDGTPMSAQTPTEYTIGIIDSGDDEPWFIDNTTVEKLTGGAIQTSGWTRSTGSAVGIVRIEYTDTTGFSASDIGKTVTNATGGDSGTLLDYNDTGTTNYAWIRPDSSAAADDWDSTSGQLDVTGGTTNVGTQSAAAVTGEDLWANINTIGSIQSNTHIYVQQDGALLTAAKDTTDWWGDGQIDILIKVKEMDTEVDEAVVTVFARRHASTYSFFTTDLTNGGRTAIPLSAGVDLNNTAGYREMALTTASGTFAVGDVITDDSDSTIAGVVTSVSGTGANQTIQYYLIGDPLNDFTGATGALSATPSGASATAAVAPTNVNAAALAGLSITYGANTTFDVDENDTNETYSIVIDVSDEALADAYAWTQYITRRGGTTTGNTDGIEGQFYLGIDYVLQYSGTVTGGTIDEGNVVTQATSGATGTVVGHDTTNKIITLRNSRGTFNTTNAVTDGTSSGSVTPNTAADSVTPNTGAYFGTFAGGTWFLARGVVLNNVLAAEATNFQATTDDGTLTLPPNKVSVTQANTRLDDRVAIFRLTGAGGQIDKGQYTSAVAAIGDATLGVTDGTLTAISTDTPGKTAGGVLRVVDTSLNEEYRIRFSSWSGTTFTLANTTGTADAGTSDTALVDAAVDFTTAAKVGDIVVCGTSGAKGYTYVTEVTDANNLVLAGGTVSGFTTGDAYELNAIPVALTTSDTVYVPILDSYETTGTDATAGSESSTVTYVSDIPVRIVVRNAENTVSSTTPMLPYSADATITSSGLTNNTIRTKDTIKAV